MEIDFCFSLRPGLVNFRLGTHLCNVLSLLHLGLSLYVLHFCLLCNHVDGILGLSDHLGRLCLRFSHFHDCCILSFSDCSIGGQCDLSGVCLSLVYNACSGLKNDKVWSMSC